MRFFVVVALLATTLAACGKNESYEWRQKLTVTVETPKGEASGSAVVEVNWRRQSKPLADMAGARHGHKGEATVVELPGGRYLFALLKNADFIALRTFAPDKMPRNTPAAIEAFLPAAAEASRRDGVRIDVPPASYPLLVTFRDIADPKTVREVKPDDLVAHFGSGVRLKSVTLEIIDEPVTEGRVESVLGWLSPYPEPSLMQGDGRTKDIPFAMRVRHGDFIRR